MDNVEVIIPDRMYEKVVRVPDTAIVGGEIIYIVNDGFLVAKKIDIIRRVGDSILIRGGSLDGEVIVTQTFPEIGSGLRNMLFELMTPLTAIAIQRKVEEVLINFEPRINLSQVLAIPNIDRNAYDLTIKFYVIGNSQPIEVETFLERLR